MAKSCADDIKLLSGENGQMLNAIDSSNVKNQHIGSCHDCISCIICSRCTASATEHVKLLPCLHIICQSCLLEFLTGKCLAQDNSDFAAVIFSCPRCSLSIQLPHDGVAGLKNICCLQMACNCAGTSSAAVSLSCANERPSNNTSAAVFHSKLSDGCIFLLSTSFVSKTGRCENAVGSVDHSFDDCNKQTEGEVSCVVSDADELQPQNDDVRPLRSKLYSLTRDVVNCQKKCEAAVEQVRLAANDLDTRKTSVQATITQRAEYLCEVICSRRDQLLRELDREHAACSMQYHEKVDELASFSRDLEDSRQFAGAVLSAGDAAATDDLLSEVVTRLNYLLLSNSQGTQTNAGLPEISAIKLDIPDPQHEESHLEKLYGGIVKGTYGATDLLQSYNTDLHWPTGFVVTASRESVLIGKAGAFAKKGEVLFCDRNGSCLHRHILASSYLPVDVVVANGSVLVSDVSGRITKFTPAGYLEEEWEDVFSGTSGHMATDSTDTLLVTSVGQSCIHRYRSTDGQRLATFSLQWPLSKLTAAAELTGITVNSANEIVVVGSNFSGPCFFSATGSYLRGCSRQLNSHEAGEASATDTASIALPSAICCDPFDNILVADFLGNSIHLVSHVGVYLGQLLSKLDGIACPNFVTLDHEGRLYVGQYGGDVLVFQYLSYVKHV